MLKEKKRKVKNQNTQIFNINLEALQIFVFDTMCCAKSLQSCLPLCDPMDCSPPGSSAHGDFPCKNPGAGCHALFQGSSQHRDQTQVSCMAGGFFTIWATRKSPRILEWVVYLFSRGSYQPRNWMRVSRNAGRFFTSWATRKAPFDTITPGYSPRCQTDRFNFFWHEKYQQMSREVLISARRVMLGWCGTYIQWNITQPLKIMK